MTLSFFDFCKTINTLTKEKRYQGALDYFKENKVNFTSEQIAGNGYLVSNILTCLRKTDRCNHAFKFIDIYKINIDENTDERILNYYGWLLHSTFKAENTPTDNNQIENDDFDEDDITEYIIDQHFSKSEIIERIESYFPLILKFNNDFNYSVVSNLFLIVLKTEKKKSNPNWKFINEFCGLISPEYLKTECRTENKEIKGVIKNIEYASDKEYWYAYKSKALIKLGMYEECYQISKTALEQFDKFHYSNDVWFSRRLTISKIKLGNTEDAISELRQILKRKNEWYIQKELAELYRDAGEIENSFNYAIAAINNSGDLEYKVGLLFLLGQLLNEKHEIDLSFKHFSLSYLLRVTKEWNIPKNLLMAIQAFNKEQIPLDNLQSLKRELRKFWDSLNTAPERNSGKVAKILHNNEKGIDGFLKNTNDNSVYFVVKPSEKIIGSIVVGLEVTFQLSPSQDGSKERAVKLQQIAR